MAFFVVVNTEFNRINYPNLIGSVINQAPSYVMVKKIDPYRKHTCWQCNYEWIAPVVLAMETQLLSGEQTEYCPKCHTKASCSSAWIKSNGDAWDFEPVPSDDEMKEIRLRLKELGFPY